MSVLASSWTDHGSVSDADGVLIGPYDDVELLTSAPILNFGNDADQSIRDVPEGTRATVLLLGSGPEQWIDAECYPLGGGFVFAQIVASKVRLLQRAADKLETKTDDV